MEQELKDIDVLIACLKRVKRLAIDREKKSNKRMNAYDNKDVSVKRLQAMTVDLDWACMEYDKAKTDFARAYSKSSIKTSTDIKEYNPSPFHKYTH